MSGAGVTVRLVRDDELEVAGDVIATAYREQPGMDEDEEYLAEVRDARGRARACEILVAIDGDGSIVGCVSYLPDPGGPMSEVARDGEAEFRMLGVLPEARGAGVGRALAEACIERARTSGRSCIVLSTPPEWTVGQRLYERLGFVRVPERDHEPVEGVLLWAYALPL